MNGKLPLFASLIIQDFLLSMLLFVSSRNNCSVYVQIFKKAEVIVIGSKIFENYNYTRPKSLNYNYNYLKK